jgi:hypothetical protein
MIKAILAKRIFDVKRIVAGKHGHFVYDAEPKDVLQVPPFHRGSDASS